MIVKVARRQFTVDEYYRMAEAGILGEDEDVELLEGDIWAKTRAPQAFPSGTNSDSSMLEDVVATKIARRQFTVDEYYRMAEAGILGEDDHVELIEGEIVEMTPIGSHHASIVTRLCTLLIKSLASDIATVSVQNPVRLNDFSEPQPDITVSLPRADFYANAHPTSSDVLLLIEVAASSLEYDRDVKLAVYARAGIVEVWIIDLAGGSILVYTQPSGDGYASQRVAGRGDAVAPVSLPDLRLAVEDILG